MGLGHHQFRMVGWDRACRYADFSYPFVIPAGLENRCKPCGGSDDDICSNVRRAISNLAYGQGMDVLFYITLSKYTGSRVAKFQFPITLGCICDINLFHRFFIILVLRFVTRPGHRARPGKIEMEKVFLWYGFLWMERFNQTLATS